MTNPNSIQLYAQVSNRAIELTNQLWDIDQENESETIRTPEGEFDNRAWLQAENQELVDTRERLMEVVSVDEAVRYADQ